MMKLSLSLVTLALSHNINTCSSYNAHLIESLPSYGKTPTPQYSGYLDGSAGCNTAVNGADCQIHYWFALAEQNPSTAPVVLWLNGGPGASSMIGFLQENGPLLINAEGTLMENPYSWTKHANLLTLEAPVGVGYSYCTRQVEEKKPCENTDRYTASTSRAALVDFFENKFPEFAGNEFFVTGESYAGVYIPTLTKEILEHSLINIKGIAVGDPCTDNQAQHRSMDSLWYAHKYALVDDEIYDLLWNTCHVRMPNLMTRGGKHLVAHDLNKELKKITNLKQRNIRAKQLLKRYTFQTTDNEPLSEECTMAYRKYILSSSRGLSQSWKDLYIDDYSLFSPVSSLEDHQMIAYMSRIDVQKALHVYDAPIDHTWNEFGANVGFDYTSEYNACNWNENIVFPDTSMVDFYIEIAPKLERTWIYNGDADPCVSYEGTRLAVKQICFNELDGGSYRPWFYNQTAASIDLLQYKSAMYGPNLVAQDMGAQFGGEVTDYEHGLKFVTFHGSGHMVPQFRPQAALHFLSKFVKGNELTPLFVSNSTLTHMEWKEFAKFRDEWTEKAMAPPYVQGDDEVVVRDDEQIQEGFENWNKQDEVKSVE